MQIVLLEAAHIFDLNAAILEWLLAAVQPKKQLPWHTIFFNEFAENVAVLISPLHVVKLRQFFLTFLS